MFNPVMAIRRLTERLHGDAWRSLYVAKGREGQRAARWRRWKELRGQGVSTELILLLFDNVMWDTGRDRYHWIYINILNI